MTDDDFFDESKPLSSKKKRRDGKWGEKFKIRSGEKIYTVSRAIHGRMSPTGEWGCSCPGWIFNRAICKHIDTIAEFVRLRDRIPEDRLVANIDFLVDDVQAFHFWGRKAIYRTEKLTGTTKDQWVFTRWMATSIPTVYYDVGQNVRLIVTYQEHDDRYVYNDEGIQ